jgi:hypothetical protein
MQSDHRQPPFDHLANDTFPENIDLAQTDIGKNTLIVTCTNIVLDEINDTNTNLDSNTNTILNYTELNSTTTKNKYDVIIVLYVINFIHSPKELFQQLLLYSHVDTQIYLYIKYYDSVRTRVYGFLNDGVVSDFTSNSVKTLCQEVDLCVSRVHLQDTFQNYCIYQVQLHDTSNSNLSSCMVDELETDLYLEHAYQTFAYELKIFKNTLENILLWFKCNDYCIIHSRDSSPSSTNNSRVIDWIRILGLNYLVDSDVLTTVEQCDTNILITYQITNAIHVWQTLSRLALCWPGRYVGKIELLNLNNLSLFTI